MKFEKLHLSSAKHNAVLSLGTSSHVLSAITGTGIVTEDGTVSDIWEESGFTYMTLRSGKLHRASSNGKCVVSVGDDVTAGTVWYNTAECYLKMVYNKETAMLDVLFTVDASDKPSIYLSNVTNKQTYKHDAVLLEKHALLTSSDKQAQIISV